jgi:arylsulfatase A-like enzyme
MNRPSPARTRGACVVAFAAAAILLTSSCQDPAPVSAAERSTTPPNVLILMAEDLSHRIGAFGDPLAVTPNIDSLAASGVRFPNTFTTAGVCAPSRAAQITGMHQIAIGAQHMRTRSFQPTPYRTVPPAEVKAYPELLRRAGYFTFTNHKLDYQFSNFGAGTGPFTIWDAEGRDSDWSGRAENQPFFGLINFGATHESQMFEANVAKNRTNGLARVTDPDAVALPPYYPDTPVIREDIARHYDNIHEMDRQVGEWLDRLQAEGLADNTIVIWTTDHGDGLPRSKREIYDSGIRVPLVVRWPEALQPAGLAPGAEDRRLVSFVDIGPSVLAWAGVPVPGFMHGRPVLADPLQVREYVHASKDRLDEYPYRERAVRDRRFKYLYNYQSGEPGARHLAYRDQLATMQELWTYHGQQRMNAEQAFWFEPRPQEEFYDLQADPFEVHNLAGNPAWAGEMQRMRQALRDWLDRVGDYSDEPEAEMALRFWPGGVQPVTPPPRILVDVARVALDSETEGASIGFRLDEGPWRVYTGPFTAAKGMVVSAKAVRYGWEASAVVTATVGQ